GRGRVLGDAAGASAGLTGGRAVAGVGVVDEVRLVIPRDVHAAPRVGVNRVADDVVRSAGDVEGRDAVATVAVDQAVDDERAGVAAGDRDPAVTFRAAVAEDAQPLQVDRLILIAAAEQRDGLAAGAGNGQPAHGDELRLLELHGVAASALGHRALEDHAAHCGSRVGLDDDPIGLARAGRIVLAGDRHLLVIRPGLDLDRLTGQRRVHRGLDGQ